MSSVQQEQQGLLPPTHFREHHNQQQQQQQQRQRYQRAHAVLQGVILLVISYALGMILAGRSFAIPLFDALRFGPNVIYSQNSDDVKFGTDAPTHTITVDPFTNYCVFIFGVLGSVIVGWMTLLWYVIHDGCRISPTPLPSANVSALSQRQQQHRAWSRKVVAISVAVWFVFDTTFSFVIGSWQHGIFNIPFVALLAVPLAIMERSDDDIILDKSSNEQSMVGCKEHNENSQLVGAHS